MPAQIEPGRAEHLDDALDGAQRAFTQPARELRLEVALGGKPAFKGMLRAALQVKYFHGAIIAALRLGKRG